MTERGWKFILVGSVVLNVFMLGAIGGGAYQWFSTHRDLRAAGAPASHTALRFAADELPDARQQEFDAALKAARRTAAISRGKGATTGSPCWICSPRRNSIARRSTRRSSARVRPIRRCVRRSSAVSSISRRR